MSDASQDASVNRSVKTTIAADLPGPEFTDASNSILFLATAVAHGTHAGSTYELDQAPGGVMFGLIVKKPDGTTIREHMNLKPLLEAWVADVIGRRPSPDECDHMDRVTVSTDPDGTMHLRCTRCEDEWTETPEGSES